MAAGDITGIDGTFNDNISSTAKTKVLHTFANDDPDFLILASFKYTRASSHEFRLLRKNDTEHLVFAMDTSLKGLVVNAGDELSMRLQHSPGSVSADAAWAVTLLEL